MTSENINTHPDDRKVFQWLWKNYLRPYRGLLAIGFLLMAIEGSMLGVLAKLIQPMFDNVFIAGNEGLVWWVGAGIMGIFVVRAVTSILYKLVLSTMSRKSIAALQKDVMGHLLMLDQSFFATHPPGYLIERVHGDVAALSGVWSAILRGAGRDVVALTALLAVTISIDWRWTLAGMIGVPLMVLPSMMVQRYTKKHASAAREVAGHMATRLDEVFHGVSLIKFNVLEAYNKRRYGDLADRQVDIEVRTQVSMSTLPSIIDIMTGLGFATVIVYGGFEIISGDKTVGQFMAFFTAMGLAFEPLRRLGAVTGLLNQAAISLSRARTILEMQPTLVAPDIPAPMPTDSTVRLDDVHLAFGDMKVLKGVSFTAPQGKTTAIVGPSGAGKSTVFNLVARMVDPQDGRVLLDDTDLRDFDPLTLRRNMSVVAQETLLFDDTIRENVLLGRDDVSEPELSRILDAAHVSEFLATMPNGLDSPVGPRGSNLSGGQRQRIAIARALLRDTPVLLLDEATSALDTQSERLVQDALNELSEGRTTLVIAHRLSTIQNADQIVVMQDGRVVETGTHNELLRQNGLYADLCRLQFSSAEEE